ncbi:MAG TPA: putative baseplate assembly protein [Pyrinomonadaceae bacterium]|jgi:hypothetical protein|nr:putative baseplate assembly protein [Pyrinomonadaceae bacterium]
MPLAEQEPKLDDRTFEELYRDLRLRIPRYTKEWTNYNESDPGITLLQLFAWLSEMMLVRMNQIPRKNYIKFLRLLGQELRPAKPARVDLTFFTKEGNPQTIRERTQVSAQLPDGEPPIIFETLRPLDPIKPPLEVVGVLESGSLVNLTAANQQPGTKFRPLGWFGEVDSALYLGFKVVNSPAPLFPGEMAFRVFLPPEATAGRPQRTDDPIPPAPVSIIWEYRPRDGEDWTRLNVFLDESAAFTREGYIRVEGPSEIEPSNEPRLHPTPLFWIRARLDGGVYPGAEGPEIDFIRPNTVPAESLVTVTGSILGTSDGEPQQDFLLPFRPVQPDSLKVVTEVNDTIETWERVDDFLASSPNDRHFVLNATEGSIRFGDGNHGEIPPASASVVADHFRYGGSARGNQAGPGTIKNPRTNLDGIEKVTNERTAAGGANEQTLDELLIEGPSIIKRRERAITANDFESFAREIGGVKNVVALVNTHPDFPGVQVPGSVTVVIVPDVGGTPPQPSTELIRAVCSQLEPRRLITTEVYVKGPDYKQVRIEADLAAKQNASFDSVARNVKKALQKLLDPRTRTFGKDLHTSEIFKVILDADSNITSVKNLNIYLDGRPVDVLKQIAITGAEMLYGEDHLVVVRPEQDR